VELPGSNPGITHVFKNNHSQVWILLILKKSKNNHGICTGHSRNTKLCNNVKMIMFLGSSIKPDILMLLSQLKNKKQQDLTSLQLYLKICRLDI